MIHIIDFGLVVLIWMTQLLVYPAFLYYSEENLYKWHRKYTNRVTLIVMPLMVGQIAMHLLSIYDNFTFLKLFVLTLLAHIWLHTFLVAVPLHNKISSRNNILQAASKLVTLNWYRTIGWTVVFLLGLSGL